MIESLHAVNRRAHLCRIGQFRRNKFSRIRKPDHGGCDQKSGPEGDRSRVIDDKGSQVRVCLCAEIAAFIRIEIIQDHVIRE